MTEVMNSPEAPNNPEEGKGTSAEPGLDCRLTQIEKAIAEAEAWVEENAAEVAGEQMMSRDPWDREYNRLQEAGMEETRSTIERLEAEREAIKTKKAEFSVWCKERYGNEDSK